MEEINYINDIHYTDYETPERVWIYCEGLWINKYIDHLKPREENIISLKNGFRFTIIRNLVTCLDCKNKLIKQGKYI